MSNFDNDNFLSFVQSKIVTVGISKRSPKVKDILAFCAQDSKNWLQFFNCSKTSREYQLSMIFGQYIKNKPGSMCVRVYLLYEFGFKKCSSCSETKSIDLYNTRTRSFKSLHEECKLCQATWNKTHKDIRNQYTATRRARLLNAEPNWLSEKQKYDIRQFYKEARDKSCEEGTIFHVDHIVPLQGKNVCGLHVPWNLQVIPSAENLRKGNKYNDV